MDNNLNLISAKDAAQRLNISRGMLSKLVKSGQLGVFRIGDRTLFDENLLETFKESVYVEPRDERRAMGGK